MLLAITVAASCCEALLFLLRRITVDPQPSDAQQAHMTKVMYHLCRDIEIWGEEEEEEERYMNVVDNDQPDAARDECIRLLIENGAEVVRATSPVMKRIIRERFVLARAPQLLNEAVLGVALARGQEQQPRKPSLGRASTKTVRWELVCRSGSRSPGI